MANETILQIGRTVRVPDVDASMELDGVALGSAQVPCANLNLPLDSGLYTIPSATAVLFTVNYPNGPLPVAPTRFRLTKIIPTAGANMFDAWIVAGWNATSFQLAISGPAGDTSHQVFWEAL
jgi:hypothetical protein